MTWILVTKKNIKKINSILNLVEKNKWFFLKNSVSN